MLREILSKKSRLKLIISSIALASIFFIYFLLTKTSESYVPKPKAFLGFNLPNRIYEKVELSDLFFEKNMISKYDSLKNEVLYRKLNCIIHLSYNRINKNLRKYLIDAQKITFNHTIKADEIKSRVFLNNQDKVFGMIYTVTGNAASPIQFYATDSLIHFINGSVYFNNKPNYDSIYPIANYLEKDVEHILKTLRWKKDK